MDTQHKESYDLDSLEKIIQAHVAALNSDRADLSKSVDRDTVVHDVANAIQKKIAPLIRACRKSCIGKSPEEREIVMMTTIYKIEEMLTQDDASTRDNVLYAKGKLDALEKSVEDLHVSWNSGVADLRRINEVADMIKQGDEPVNGRNRKPGTRPEKLSVVRKAQAEVEKNEVEFDGKA